MLRATFIEDVIARSPDVVGATWQSRILVHLGVTLQAKGCLIL